MLFSLYFLYFTDLKILVSYNFSQLSYMSNCDCLSLSYKPISSQSSIKVVPRKIVVLNFLWQAGSAWRVHGGLFEIEEDDDVIFFKKVTKCADLIVVFDSKPNLMTRHNMHVDRSHDVDNVQRYMVCCHFWLPCMVALFCCWQRNDGFCGFI